jgi:hypothetical protein
MEVTLSSHGIMDSKIHIGIYECIIMYMGACVYCALATNCHVIWI